MRTFSMAILTVNVTPEDANISLIATGFEQQGNTIEVNVGTLVYINISKVGYVDIHESITIMEDTVKTYDMELEEYTVTFSVYPKGTTASTTIKGVTQEGFKRKCFYGDLLDYSFEKEGYETRKGTLKVIGNETKKIILIAKRQINNPDTDHIKEHRDMKKMYPSQFTEKLPIANYINSVVNPFFEKPDEVAVNGYIGQRNQNTEENAQFIQERTMDRQVNQLTPVAITKSDIGEEVLPFKSFIGTLKTFGIPTENQNKFLHSKQWSWCPLVNIDMLINYSMYHWLGYDKIKLPSIHFVGLTNAVRDIIGKKSYTYEGNVQLFQGELLKQEYNSTVPFYDGMRIMFMNDENPEYNDIMFIVSGVGGEIVLTEESDYVPVSEEPDYYVIEKGSIDQNDWSYANRWVYKRVLEIMAPDAISEFEIAQRPIICYQKDYELYNHGTFYRGYVDIAYKGAVSDINGTTENIIQGVTIVSGMTILFVNAEDNNMHQLFRVNKLDSGVNILQSVYNGQDTEDLAATKLNDYVRIRKGTYAGKTIYYNGEEWVDSQVKTELNQEPLYKLYDSDGVYIGSEAQYPMNNFNGGIVFDYYISDDESVIVDPYVGKRIVSDIYGNYDFVNTIASLEYEYVDLTGESAQIKGYFYAKNIRTGAFNNGWLYKEDTSYQKLVTQKILNDNDIINGTFSYVIPFENFSGLQIKYNGKIIGADEYEELANGFSINNVKTGDEFQISFFANDFDEMPEDYTFSLPLSFTTNQFNENIEKFNIKDVLEHLSSILQNQDGFEGNPNGSNNCYALDVDGSKGTYIVQTDNSILLPMLLENNEATSVLNSIQFSSKNYNQIMEKVRNLSSIMVRKNIISESDYNLYHENPTLLDDTIKNIFKQINLGKNENSPFYNNGVAIQLGNLYIPATPAFLGIQKPVRPKLTTDNKGNEIIICHDGAIIEASHSVVDLIRYELELCIYDSIFSEFKTRNPSFLAVDNISGYYRKEEYSYDQYLSVYGHYFIRWAIQNNIDYTTNNEAKTSDWRGWNWSNSQMEDGTLLRGSYRAIYKYFFDTVDPSQYPWEMFGFNEKPSWWNIAYGEAPYTSNNLVLWNDAKDGYIRGEDRIDLRYARPTILEHIPVDTQGNLISPYECHISVAEPTVYARSQAWKIGDISDAEYEFMKTSEYRYALEAINYILRPVEWIGDNWNTQSIEIKYKDTRYQQTIDKTTYKRPSLKNQIIHNTKTDGVLNRVFGSQQWIVDYLMYENKSIDTYMVNRISNLEMKLGYCVGGFYEKDSVELLDENEIIPSDNMELKLIENKSGESFSYSAIKIIKQDTGYCVVGFDALKTYFSVLEPIKNNKKSSKEVNGVTFTSYLNYDVNKVKSIPYGTVFNTPNEVLNFIRGYEKYLTEIEGWGFVGLNANGERIDFNLALQTFMQWVTMDSDTNPTDDQYPMLVINPGALSIELTHFGNIQNANIKTNGEPNVVDLYYNGISSNDFTIMRNSFSSLYSMTTDKIAGSYRAIQTEFEDILLIDRVTVFGDVLYNPIFSIMKENLHITAVKSAQWDGSLYSPGYLNMEDGLLPNLEKNVFDLNYIYDVDDIKCQLKYREYSKTLVGYSKTKCIQELIRNEKSMFDFYKGMIADKGTLKPIIAMNRSSLVSSSETDINNIINSYWAFKAGEYGQIAGNTSLEFLLDKSLMHSNPQSITYCPIAGTEPDDTYVITNDDPLWLKKNIASVNSNLAQKYIGDIIIPPVGFVNLEDVDYVVANMTEFDQINDSVLKGQFVFIVDTGDNDWNVVKKTGDDHYVSMRYDTLLDAYKKQTQDLVYEFLYNDTVYYSNKSSSEIQNNDLIYSDINLTTTVGTYKSLGMYEYTGNTVVYPAMTAYKAKLFNTVFKTVSLSEELNRDSLLYCYADDSYYPYSSLTFKVGSSISAAFTTKRYKFTVRVENYVENAIITINGTEFSLTKDKQSVTIYVDYGTKVYWEVKAPHCKTVSGSQEIVDTDIPATSLIVPVYMYYMENEYIYNSVGDNNNDSKFTSSDISIGCTGIYEITMNGAGGGAGGGATYYVGTDKNVRDSNIVSNNVYDMATYSQSTVTYLGSVITENSQNDSRAAGQGGAAGGYIKGRFTAYNRGVASIVVGKGGHGGTSGITVGSTGTNGSSTTFSFHNEDKSIEYLNLIAGGGAAGMGALTNQISTGSTNEKGEFVLTGTGGIVLKSGDTEVMDSLVLDAFSNGISTIRVSGAGAAPTMNPDGFNYMTPLYNETGFGGKPVYMSQGEDGDNGRLQIKFIKSISDEIQPDMIIDEYAEEISVDEGATNYSLVYQRFVLNTWSAFIPNPDPWMDSTQKKKRYLYGDCVSYNGKKYYCRRSHNNSHSFDTSAWFDYTNLSDLISLKELPFYTYGIIGYNPLYPLQEVFDDTSMMYKSRVKQASCLFKPTVVINEYNDTKQYVVGDMISAVLENEVGYCTYRCIKDVKGTKPTLGAKYWVAVSYTNEQEQAYDGTTQYNPGDIVVFNAQLYQCIEQNTGIYPDIFWVLDYQNVYIKYIMDRFYFEEQIQQGQTDILEDYFPLYWDEECKQPILDDNGIQLEYQDILSAEYGSFTLTDEIGTYGEIKLTYLIEPSWNPIQANSCYSFGSGNHIYYTSMDPTTMDSYKGTVNDVIYNSDDAKSSTLAVQYNNTLLKYSDVTDVVTYIDGIGYEISNGENTLYVKDSFGHLTNETMTYGDNLLVIEMGIYGEYLPVWTSASVKPNDYSLDILYPEGNTVYEKIGNDFIAKENKIYVKSDDEYILFVPQTGRFRITIPGEEVFYSDTNGTVITNELYLYNGSSYYKINPTELDVHITYNTCNMNGFIVLTKVGNEYKYAGDCYVKRNDEYVSFIDEFFSDILNGYSKIQYNSSSSITNLYDLYEETETGYEKLSGDLYSKLFALDSNLYFDSGIVSDRIQGIVRNGTEKQLVGIDGYFNSQCQGIHVGLNQILTTRNETATINLYRDIENDVVYNLARELQIIMSSSSPVIPEEWVVEQSELYAKTGDYVNPDDILNLYNNNLAEGEIVQRIATIYHYYYSENNERVYMKLYHYGNLYYMPIPCEGKIWANMFTVLGTEGDLVTFYKHEQEAHEENTIINSIIYKNDGDILYIKRDQFFTANIETYKDVICDIFGVGNTYASKTLSGEYGWIKAEVLGQEYQFNLAGIEEYQPDNTIVDSVYYIDDKTDKTLGKVKVVDPIQGIYPLDLTTEVQYISANDPIGSYNDSQNFSKVKLGDLWWDISKVKYLNYKQRHSQLWWYPKTYTTTDNEFKANNWVKQLNGSEIVINEWTSSKDVPNVSDYITHIEFDNKTKLLKKVYYYWKKNPLKLPYGSLREHTAIEIADRLNASVGSGLMMFGFTDYNNTSSSFVITNYAFSVSNHDTVVQINFDLNKCSDSHADWDMVKENTNDKVPEKLWKQLYESLVEYRMSTNGDKLALPDPSLPDSMKYGIQYRPRQSMIFDVYEAKRNLVEILNGITLNRSLLEATDVDSELVDYVDEPEAGSYVYEVEQYSNLKRITETDYIGQNILVKYDETHNNIWAIYRMVGINNFVLVDWQKYNIENFFEYEDLYVSTDIPKLGIIATVETVAELYSLDASEGDIARMYDNDKWVLYQKTGNTWELVGKEDALIKFTDALYSYESLKDDETTFIDLSKSPLWLSDTVYLKNYIVKTFDGDNIRFWKCLTTHTSLEEFNEYEQNYWVEIFNETLYDYKKNESDLCLKKILDYFAEDSYE